MSSAFHDLLHLARRFGTSLTAQALTEDEQAWISTFLLPGERALWRRMSVADQRHAHGVAVKVRLALGDDVTRPIMAAALLHDAGKVESGLGTLGRSWATVRANLGSHDERVRQYRAHNEIGQRLLEAAGSDVFTSTWAYEHELPRNRWTVDHRIGDALHAADDD